MEESLEDLYFNWLCAKITLSEAPSQSYSILLRVLHAEEFVWLILGDDNRAEDGRDLRLEFIRESRLAPTTTFHEDPCSVLEMLIAFARRAEFQTELSLGEWFWIFIANLGLADCYDDNGVDPDYISEVIYNFVWRTYDFEGTGGLFPMRDPVEDQTKVELLYQFSEYLVDHDLF